MQFARGRVPVIAGTGGNATTEALELHQIAKDAGATAGLSVNPYYNKPTQEGLYRHFMTLADKVDLPIVLYNIPGRTGITMTPQTVARLNEHQNIVAIKEATGSLDMASEIMSPVRHHGPLRRRLADAAADVASAAKGVISVASNLLPGEVKQMAKHALDGDFAEAADDPPPAVPADQDAVPRRQPRRHQVRDEARRPGHRRAAPAAVGSQRATKARSQQMEKSAST